MSHSAKNVLSFMSAEPLFFFSCCLCMDYTDLVVAANISNVSLAKKGRRSTATKTSVIFCLFCCNLCTVCYMRPDWPRTVYTFTEICSASYLYAMLALSGGLDFFFFSILN